MLGILDTGIKSSPHSAPVKDTFQRQREIEGHQKEVFNKTFLEPCELLDEGEDDGYLLDL